MKCSGHLSINEFAKYAHSSYETLRFYDRVGLFGPASRGENKYRQYSARQIGQYNYIRLLQLLGLTIGEIQEMIDYHHNPKEMSEFFAQKAFFVRENVEKWTQAEKFLKALQKNISDAFHADETSLSIQYLQAETIVMGELNDYSDDRNDYDALYDFYESTKRKYPSMDLSYPVWGIFSAQRVKKGDIVWPDRYYICNPEGSDMRPAGLYAVGYTRSKYGESNALCKRMLEYIDKTGFEVRGNTYKEYLLNEYTTADEQDYLVRLRIGIGEKREPEPLNIAKAEVPEVLSETIPIDSASQATSVQVAQTQAITTL